MKTDSTIRADVETELKWEPSLDERGIIIAVKDGVVTLGGHVPSYVDKWASEKAAKNVSGVLAIVNEIVVKPAVAREDQNIAEAAVAALKASVSVPADSIKVIVRDGWITLEGKVAYWYQKNAAENAVRTLWGVKGITNGVEIRPQVKASDIRGKIHAAYKRHADIDASNVLVDVIDGTVTLTGRVHSWHERDDAENAAWSAPGVTRVKNDLTLSA